VILEWLAADVEELFNRNREVRVALWFDEKQEFSRLLSGVREALARRGMEFLAYDESERHGAVWIKWQLEAGPLAEAGRVLVWLPFSRERLHQAEVRGVGLAPLLEYEYSGKVWLIDGKRPTLFGLLRRHGVPLPESRSEQNALWRGGRDSLLAKYVERNASRDAEFWTCRRLTPSAVKASLVGDVTDGGVRGLRHGDAPAREGAAQEDGRP
jgi:hypothetical protein